MRKASLILLLVVCGGCNLAATEKATEKAAEKPAAPSPAPSPAVSPENAADSPESLIRRIYDDHQPWNKKDIFQARSSGPQIYQKTLARYFDEELTRLLVEDSECAAKTKEICRLDFDPIIAGQDFDDHPNLDLKISKIDSPQNSSYQVTFTNIERKTLIYHLRQTAQGWRVSDIVDGQSSLKDLLREKIQ